MRELTEEIKQLLLDKANELTGRPNSFESGKYYELIKNAWIKGEVNFGFPGENN